MFRPEPPQSILMLDAAELEALTLAAEGKPLAMAKLAEAFLAAGKDARARELCARALALTPGDAEVSEIAGRIVSAEVPDWHFAIVRDAARNAVYDAALRRAVGPGSLVLEIGTGTGILAMMAARAGAAEVVTCEANEAVAERAAHIVACNGYADRVRVVVKHSKDLALGTDLRERADVLVSEIIPANLLGERALEVMADVVPRLLKPGAAVIPASGAIRVALVEDARDEKRRLGVVDGFDLSAFNRLAKPRYMVSGARGRLKRRSNPADLFTFDFRGGEPYAPGGASRTLVASGGTVTGIAQWIFLGMDELGTYENPPESDARSCWDINVHCLPRPLDMKAGDTLVVHGRHDGMTPYIWADLPVP